MEKKSTGDRKKAIPSVSATFGDGTLLELLYDPSARRTSFALWTGEAWKSVQSFTTEDGRRLIPFAPDNNLIRNDVVLLPSHPVGYRSESELVADLQSFIHRYVDVSPRFERIAAYYVLLTWVYDRFNEVPYLRLRGDYGSGKTRFLLIVGSLCHRAVFASGASTVSPIFHSLDAYRGTLIIDEGDFRWSDEKAEIVKILNNGNVRGLPVLRTEVSPTKEFNPRAFQVFGPKIVATRGEYRDRALESRFITEELGNRPLRPDIPINLPSSYKVEAQHLRNKLLMYRFQNHAGTAPDAHLVEPGIEARLNQVFVPLLSIAKNEELQSDLRGLAREYHEALRDERSMDIEAHLLVTMRNLFSTTGASNLSIRDIAVAFNERHGEEYGRSVSNKRVGFLVRKKLGLRTHKSHGNFVVSADEKPKLERLYMRFGIGDEPAIEQGHSDLVWEPVDNGEMRDEKREPQIE